MFGYRFWGQNGVYIIHQISGMVLLSSTNPVYPIQGLLLVVLLINIPKYSTQDQTRVTYTEGGCGFSLIDVVQL